ncbi:hypothetical protein [Mesobacillus zeae]|uniref:hypothetical protein n=1 Tax=Mesobacillus zeae TaxID=1917180 RepID=UPI00300B50E1
MSKKWKVTEKVIKKFQKKHKDKNVVTLDDVIKEVDPQRIIAINETYDYPSILNDYKMNKLKKSVEENGWTNENPSTIYLFELPNGDLLVAGCGNHRAVLSKELSIPSIKATVGEVKILGPSRV